VLEFLLAPLILVALPFLVPHPVLLFVCVLLLLPGAYAMWSGAPYVPTPKPTMDEMFRLARIQPGERIYDLGCGDGRLIFQATQQGADATGFELAFLPYLSAKLQSFFRGGSIRYGDFWRKDVSDANVIFVYLLTESMQTFKQRLWPSLKPGTRVISHAFSMHGIEPTEQSGKVRLYVKP